jgi:hypothetical protein
MKLSIESAVAAAVALAFGALSVGVMAKEQNDRGTVQTHSSALTHMSGSAFATSFSNSNGLTGQNEVLGPY